MNRGVELEPGFKKTTLTQIKGKRSVNVTPLIKTQATPEDIYTVSIPALNANQFIIPDTFALSFKFANSNTKSWFKNNLGRLLVDRLSINVQRVEVYQNTGESLMEVYNDFGDRKRTKITDKILVLLPKTLESSCRKTTAQTKLKKPTEFWILPLQTCAIV